MKDFHWKLIKLFVFILIAFIAFLIVRFVQKKNIENLSDDSILIEEYHYDFSVSDGYFGKAIYNDGRIYEFSFDRSDDLAGLSLQERSEKILKMGVLLEEKVEKKDLNEIRKYIVKLEDRYVSNVGVLASATQGLSAYQYSTEKWIKLVQEGEQVGKNKTAGTDTIIKVIQKYNLGVFES